MEDSQEQAVCVGWEWVVGIVTFAKEEVVKTRNKWEWDQLVLCSLSLLSPSPASIVKEREHGWSTS